MPKLCALLKDITNLVLPRTQPPSACYSAILVTNPVGFVMCSVNLACVPPRQVDLKVEGAGANSFAPPPIERWGFVFGKSPQIFLKYLDKDKIPRDINISGVEHSGNPVSLI